MNLYVIYPNSDFDEHFLTIKNPYNLIHKDYQIFGVEIEHGQLNHCIYKNTITDSIMKKVSTIRECRKIEKRNIKEIENHIFISEEIKYGNYDSLTPEERDKIKDEDYFAFVSGEDKTNNCYITKKDFCFWSKNIFEIVKFYKSKGFSFKEVFESSEDYEQFISNFTSEEDYEDLVMINDKESVLVNLKIKPFTFFKKPNKKPTQDFRYQIKNAKRHFVDKYKEQPQNNGETNEK